MASNTISTEKRIFLTKRFVFLTNYIFTHLHIELTKKLRKEKADCSKTNSQQNQM